MRCNLGTDPRVLRIAEGLSLHELHVVGLLWRFWSWADQHTTCDAVSVTESLLDRITCVGFASQLRAVGWLEVTENGIRLPHFEEHNGQTAKKRALTSVRMKRFRDAGSVTHASPEKRREEKIDQSVSSGAGAPLFDEFWSSYPRRVGKKASEKSFYKLTNADQAKAVSAAKAYAEATAQWQPQDKQYIPHPATWLNQGRYEDDPATWKRTEHANDSQRNSRWFSQQQDYSGVTDK